MKGWSGKKEDASMQTLKAMLCEITKSKRYDGIEALGYYKRLTEVKWDNNSLLLYEESLLRDDFVTHNTILAIFTDMDKQTEKTIKKERPMKLSKKELQEKITSLGLVFRVRDTKEELIKIIHDSKKVVQKDKGSTGKVSKTVAKRLLQEELNNLGLDFNHDDSKKTLMKILEESDKRSSEDKEPISADFGIPIQTDVKKATSVDTLEEFVQTNPDLSINDLISGTSLICKKLKEQGHGGKLLSKLETIMKKDMETWILTHTIEADEQNRKYVYIKKLKAAKDKGEPKDKLQTVPVVSSEVISDLTGVVLTDKILSDLDWVTLKKLSKSRGFNSFGKSREVIIEGILRIGKKADKKANKKATKRGKKVIKGLSGLKDTII